MSITNELRKYADELETAASRKSEHGFSPAAMKLTAIADRIDAEHEKAVHELNCIASDSVLLPRDADGVPIRPGETMQERSGNTFDVGALMCFTMHSPNWLVLSDPRNFSTFREPHDITHYRAPTVEDVLEEFVARWLETHHDDLPSLKTEFAAKLQLKEGA